MTRIPQKPSSKGLPPSEVNTLDNLVRPEREPLEGLNFKINPAFKREFKTYAAAHGLTMASLLMRGFELVKRERH